MNMKLKKMIMDYLDECKLMTIATVNGNKPWAATVWYVHGKDFSLYFLSRRGRRHSLELKNNPNAAGTITKPHMKGSGEKVRGLQFEGIAKEASGKTLRRAQKLYLAKCPKAQKIPVERLEDPKFIATFYVVRPRIFVLFDEVNFPDDPRQELRLQVS